MTFFGGWLTARLLFRIAVMRLLLRLTPWILLLAGCAVPGRPTPAFQARSAPIPSITQIRVGVEILSDDPLAPGNGEVSPRPASRPASGGGPVAGPTREPERPRDPRDLEPAGSRWLTPDRVERRDLDMVPEVADRVTLRFLHGLVGRAGDRLPQALGWSYMQRAATAFDADTDWADGARLADENDALQGMAIGLLRRPFQHALRELPLVRDIELEVEDFKARNVPTSGAWLDSRAEDRYSAGRLSYRWRLSDGSDPLTVTYALQGWRVGVSRETVRAGFSTRLGDNIDLYLSTTFDHANDRATSSTELRVDLSARTRLRLQLATDIDAFPGPDLARAVEDSQNAGAGAMVYVETVF